MPATYAPDTRALLAAHAGEWLEDALSRLDPDGEVATTLIRQLTAYLDLSQCRGKRLLDFGCGVGASSLAIARLLPETEIVGVELNRERVRIATHLRNDAGLTNLRFLASPAGDQLPSDIGTFDYVMLSAVYEHLLPHERRVTMPLLWNALKPGGILFISGTPHRWFPIEHHTTGLPGLNYLPDSLTHALGSRFGKYPQKGTWGEYPPSRDSWRHRTLDAARSRPDGTHPPTTHRRSGGLLVPTSQPELPSDQTCADARVPGDGCPVRHHPGDARGRGVPEALEHHQRLPSGSDVASP